MVSDELVEVAARGMYEAYVRTYFPSGTYSDGRRLPEWPRLGDQGTADNYRRSARAALTAVETWAEKQAARGRKRSVEEARTVKCPYDDCPFEGTQAEVDDHVEYLKRIEDPEHEESARRR